MARPDWLTRTVEERFWAKVAKAGPKECWLWQGAKANYGYGNFQLGGKGGNVGAHRFSWQLHFGRIPAGLRVLHRCDVTACVNPAHLELGDQSKNMRDSYARGRRGNAKLNPDKVRQIRRMLASSKLSKAAIGRIFGVDRSAIWSIHYRKAWAHVA